MVPGLRPPDDVGGFPSSGAAAAAATDYVPRVALARTARGWSVIPVSGLPAGEAVADVIEGMTLADLLADELDALREPDRDTRRSVRGPFGASGATDGVTDEVDVRVVALERTVAQLEHAFAARVSTERAIGVLAERNGSSLRTAFEEMRRRARTEGRPVVDLAREVLDGLGGASTRGAWPEAAPAAHGAQTVRRGPVAPADGRS